MTIRNVISFIGFVIGICISIKPVFAQSPTPPVPVRVALPAELQQAKTDSARVAVLFKAGDYYYQKARQDRAYLDSNFSVLDDAEKIIKRTNDAKQLQRLICSRAILYQVFHMEDKLKPEVEKLCDSMYVRYLYVSGFHYLMKQNKPNLDTGKIFYTEAIERAEKIKDYPSIGHMYYYLAFYTYAQNDYDKARAYQEKAAAAYRKTGNIRWSGTSWFYLAAAMDTLNPNYAETRYCYQQSIGPFREVKDSISEGSAYYNIGALFSTEGILDSADIYLNKSLTLYKLCRYKKIYYLYKELAYQKRLQGDFDQALSFTLEGIKTAEAAKEPKLGFFYNLLGIVYNDLSEFQLSYEAYKTGIELYKKEKVKVIGVILKGITKALVLLGKPQQALEYLQENTKDRKGFDKLDLMVIAESYGICYAALNQFDLAEKYYGEMAGYAKLLSPSYAASSDLGMGKFYFERKLYDTARLYLIKFLQHPQYVPPSVQGEAYFMLFKADSINHSYASALSYYKKYLEKQDIIFSFQKSKQITELQVRYDIEKKDRDLKLKDQAIELREKDLNLLRKQRSLQLMQHERRSKDLLLKEQSIALLTKQAEINKAGAAAKDNSIRLNAKNIELLTRQGELQEVELKQAGIERQITIAGIVLLLIILALLYSQYRSKQKNSKNISDKNKVLESLINEKEWLLKEIHHRVKNNLQTVVSLLESQSAYLQNDALLAIQDSQNRVHAMSLIHQTLYQRDNMSTIDMSVYLSQIVRYLKDIFRADNILFSVNVACIELDVSQAVPIGLILNEAVTNAIKYAFDNSCRDRQIIVQMWEDSDDIISLSIRDNGKGIDNSPYSVGLGLTLMKELTNDIDGRLEVKSNNGTEISVVFKSIKVFYKKEIA